MKFLDGYIVTTILTGIMSLMNYLNVCDLDVMWTLSPVIFYIVLSISVSIIKEITKTKG